MKKWIIAITVLVLLAAVTCAMAEDAAPGFLQRIFAAEKALLFDTENVTMNGTATFSVDGETFKSAEVTHVQDGSTSVREWAVTGPDADGDLRTDGYTVVTEGDLVFAFESYSEGQLMTYYADEATQRRGILRHTVRSDMLVSLAESVLSTEKIACTGDAREEDQHVYLQISLGEEDTPEILQQLMNLVLQYGIERYTGYDYTSEPMDSCGEYNAYGTIPLGLVYTLDSVRLRQVELEAELDDQGRLVSLWGEAEFALKEKGADHQHALNVRFSQNAEDYGTSVVNNIPERFSLWKQDADVDSDWELDEDSELGTKAEDRAREYLVEKGLFTQEETKDLLLMTELYTKDPYGLMTAPTIAVHVYRCDDFDWGYYSNLTVWMDYELEHVGAARTDLLYKAVIADFMAAQPEYMDAPVTEIMLSFFHVDYLYIPYSDVWDWVVTANEDYTWIGTIDGSEMLTQALGVPEDR